MNRNASVTPQYCLKNGSYTRVLRYVRAARSPRRTERKGHIMTRQECFPSNMKDNMKDWRALRHSRLRNSPPLSLSKSRGGGGCWPSTEEKIKIGVGPQR